MNILIVDDSQAILDGLEMLLNSSITDVTIFTAIDLEQLFVVLSEHSIDLILLDINLKEVNTLEHISDIYTKSNKANIIYLSSYDEIQFIVKTIGKNVKGFLIKNSDIAEIVFAINQVDQGNKYINQRKNLSFSETVHRSDKENIIKLSDKEITFIRLLSRHYTKQNLTEKLGIDRTSLDLLQHAIYSKLGVDNLFDLLSVAYRNSIIGI